MKRNAFSTHYITNACLIPALCAAMMTAAPQAASAATTAQLNSHNERINFSGKLRMLSQRVAAASCNLNAGVDVEGRTKVLTNARVEFDKILGGLQTGNGDLKIEGAETNADILAKASAVSAAWSDISAASIALMQEGTDAASMETINSQNMALLDATKALVASIVSVYAISGEDAALGQTIDVAGRQRMLTQKMSKEACQILSGDAAAVEKLQATMALFESALINLRDGTNGMIKPPNPDVKDGLAHAWDDWQSVKPILEAAMTGGTLSMEDRAALAKGLDTEMRDMNKVVGLYVVAKKQTGNIEDVGATERVNFSGKLRMLSQRVAAAACNYEAGIDKETSLNILLGAQTEFAKIARGLEFGDADLRMNGEEKRRKTLKAIHDLNAAWADMSAAIDGLVRGNEAASNLDYISANNMNVLSHAKLLVSEISGQYSDPTAMLQADAALVDISGRQRMLTQKMSKESCQVWSGQADSAEALAGTMQMFEVSLNALRSGMPEAGIKPAPTEDIALGLDDIWADWQALKPTLETAVANTAADPAARSEVFGQLNVMLKEMNEVVGLYAIYGKTGL